MPNHLVTGWSEDDTGVRVLARFGDVVDVRGLSEIETWEQWRRPTPTACSSFDDSPLRLAAAVADACRLRFHTPATARVLTDKVAQRELLPAAGIAGPSFWPITVGECTYGENVKLVETIDYPVVLKPRAGSGSRATFLVKECSDVPRPSTFGGWALAFTS